MVKSGFLVKGNDCMLNIWASRETTDIKRFLSRLVAVKWTETGIDYMG